MHFRTFIRLPLAVLGLVALLYACGGGSSPSSPSSGTMPDIPVLDGSPQSQIDRLSQRLETIRGETRGEGQIVGIADYPEATPHHHVIYMRTAIRRIAPAADFEMSYFESGLTHDEMLQSLVDRGATVVNMSYGTEEDVSVYPSTPRIRSLIAERRSSVTFVKAAGNGAESGSTDPSTPSPESIAFASDNPNAVIVAAARNGQLARTAAGTPFNQCGSETFRNQAGYTCLAAPVSGPSTNSTTPGGRRTTRTASPRRETSPPYLEAQLPTPTPADCWP